MNQTIKKISIATWSELPEKEPKYALVSKVDLVIVRYRDDVSVMYGRCLHRGALLADGSIEGNNLICGVHNWDYRFDTGISSYNPQDQLHKFTTWIEDDLLLVDENEIQAWEKENPQPYNRDKYQGTYEDIHGSEEEPYNAYIRELAENGLSKTGMHGPASAMGVPRPELPSCDKAPKLISDTIKGIASFNGFFAFGPMITSVPTSTSSN